MPVCGPESTGATSLATTTLLIPAAFTPGPYYLSAVADSTGALQEVDETNNGRTAAATDRLLRAADVIERYGLSLYAAAARHHAACRNGIADGELFGRAVASPARLAATLVPGLGGVTVQPTSEAPERFLPPLEETLVGM